MNKKEVNNKKPWMFATRKEGGYNEKKKNLVAFYQEEGWLEQA